MKGEAASPPPERASLGLPGFIGVLGGGFFLIAGQGAAAVWLGLPGCAPEWAVTLTLYAVLRAELWAAVPAAFVLGLFRDAAGGGPLGVYPTALTAAAWFLRPMRLRFNFSAPLVLAAAVFGLTLGGDILLLTPIMATLGWPGESFNPGPSFLGSALATGLTAPPLFWILDGLARGRRRRGAHG